LEKNDFPPKQLLFPPFSKIKFSNKQLETHYPGTRSVSTHGARDLETHLQKQFLNLQDTKFMNTVKWQFSWQSTPSMTCSFYLAYYPVHMTFTYGLDTRRLCENKHSISKRWIILVQRFSVRKYQKRKLDILIFISNLKYLWIEICLY
jgi:hypothetical protein